MPEAWLRVPKRNIGLRCASFLQKSSKPLGPSSSLLDTHKGEALLLLTEFFSLSQLPVSIGFGGSASLVLVSTEP